MPTPAGRTILISVLKQALPIKPDPTTHSSVAKLDTQILPEETLSLEHLPVRATPAATVTRSLAHRVDLATRPASVIHSSAQMQAFPIVPVILIPSSAAMLASRIRPARKTLSLGVRPAIKMLTAHSILFLALTPVKKIRQDSEMSFSVTARDLRTRQACRTHSSERGLAIKT